MLIVNSFARGVSPRSKEVIAKALAADFKLEVIETTARDHASDLARDAVDRGFDAVLALGGDGTMNEAAQGVIGSDVALGVLPGGNTNVAASSIDIPLDPVEATAFLASRLRSRTVRQVNVGVLENLGRYFVFCAGVGLDAEVVRRVEADPDAKRRRGEWFFLTTALKTALTTYGRAGPAITFEPDEGHPQRVALLVCCNARPFTYFKRLPVDACPKARLDGGLDVFALARLRPWMIPRLASGLLVTRSHVRWRSSRYFHDLRGGRVRADRPLPVQVDGDYIGEHSAVDIRMVPGALRLLM